MRNSFGFSIEKIYLKKSKKIIKKSKKNDSIFSNMSNLELINYHNRLKEKFVIHEAISLFKEVCFRKIGIKPYDEQLLGALILFNGAISEMKTGEGKTIVAYIASYLSFLYNQKCFVITVNDYLSKRDSEDAKKIFDFLNIKVGYISSDMNTDENKISIYDNSDIIYESNNALGFDYLRSNTVKNWEDKAIKNLSNSFVIIDEVDSILIDESRTPLILSGLNNEYNFDYDGFNKIFSIAKSMKGNILSKEALLDSENLNKEKEKYDFIGYRKNNNIEITQSGYLKIEKELVNLNIIADNKSLYNENITLMHIIINCLKAIYLYRKDHEYLIKEKDGKKTIELIDENTGRIMDGRQLSNGLHQSIEIKEGVDVTEETITLAEISYQNLFKLFGKISGMTGTAYGSVKEFEETYGITVCRIPTVKKIKRIDYEDILFFDKENKFKSVVDKVKEINSTGRPILIGTNSVEDSEHLSELLSKEKLDHNVLNAKNNEMEAFIIANAGSLNAITISTSMAGRGTDIKLGGNLEYILEECSTDEEKEFKKNKYIQDKNSVIEKGGLFVIGVERNKSRRVDDQLIGRSGRQGDPGASQFFISMQDDLFKLFSTDSFVFKMLLKQLEQQQFVTNSKIISKGIKRCQNQAENLDKEMRDSFVKYDNILDKQRKFLYSSRDDLIKINFGYIDINDGSFKSSILSSLYGDLKDYIYNLYDDYSLDDISLQNALYEDFLIELNIDELKDINRDELYNLIFEKIENKIKKIGYIEFSNILKEYYLKVMDDFWSEHLSYSYDLKKSVGLRSYAQKKPDEEYKIEMWKNFNNYLLDKPILKSFRLLNQDIV